MSWTAVTKDAGITDVYDIYARQSMGHLDDVSHTIGEYLFAVQDKGVFGEYGALTRWTADSKATTAWTTELQEGAFGEGTFGSGFFGGTPWTTVTKAS